MSENSTSNSGDPDHHQPGLSLSSSPSAGFSTPPPISNTDYRHARFPGRVMWSAPRPLHRATPAPNMQARPRIVVVGVCSSGKSTLVRALRERGYNARSVSQEHSYVSRLWQRSQPDVLVYLDASLRTIRGRGRRRWVQSLLDEEYARLGHAREHSDLYIPTDGLAPEDVASRVLTFLSKREVRSEK
ncbi:MAG: hypothetical protein WCD37_11085 [Chloroflexia bacterium]